MHRLPPGSVHRESSGGGPEKRDWNLAVKCDLVERGQSHGVLSSTRVRSRSAGANSARRPSCPCFRAGRTPEVARTDDGPRRWRITCFCTDKRWREKGFERAGFDAKAVVPARGKLGTSRIVEWS